MIIGASGVMLFIGKGERIVLDKLHWFHAFNRSEINDILAVLVSGPEPAPAGIVSKTRENEETLGIDPSVYAYLGRTSPAFGINGFALPLTKRPPDAMVSPFDTGGLVEHIHPVDSWSPDATKGYLESYSWPGSALDSRLADYPSDLNVESYLDGERPSLNGPHVIWGGVEAELWAHPDNGWQAWTWELRTVSRIPAGYDLFRWTCPPHTFNKLFDLALSDAANTDWYRFLAERYVPGGLTQIVRLVNTLSATT